MIDDSKERRSKERERQRERNMINEAIRICSTNGHTMWQGVNIIWQHVAWVSYLEFSLPLSLSLSLCLCKTNLDSSRLHVKHIEQPWESQQKVPSNCLTNNETNDAKRCVCVSLYLWVHEYLKHLLPVLCCTAVLDSVLFTQLVRFRLVFFLLYIITSYAAISLPDKLKILG